jgi:hypothetical protein
LFIKDFFLIVLWCRFPFCRFSHAFFIHPEHQQFTAGIIQWSKSLCAPDDYNTIVRCTETFWSLCINRQKEKLKEGNWMIRSWIALHILFYIKNCYDTRTQDKQGSNVTMPWARQLWITFQILKRARYFIVIQSVQTHPLPWVKRPQH